VQVSLQEEGGIAARVRIDDGFDRFPLKIIFASVPAVRLEVHLKR